MTRTTHRREAGFTLVEVMVAAFLLLVGILGTMSLVDVANDRQVLTGQREQAVNLARDLAERANSTTYADLTDASVQAALGGPASGTWTVTMGSTQYRLALSACKVDEPIDGQGERTSGGFCAGSGPAATDDPDPDDLRRVAITVTWTGRDNRARVVTQTALVNHPGSAKAPEVLSIAPTAPIPANPSSIAFTVATTPAVRVRWFVNGERRGDVTTPSTADGRTWGFTWADTSETAVPDGTYVVAVRAYDAGRRSRNERIYRVTINRRVPAPPTAFRGGHSFRVTESGLAGSGDAASSVVDLAWTASTDPDVIGYRVFRADGTAWTQVCSAGLDDEADPRLAAGVPYRDEMLTCADRTPTGVYPMTYAVVPVDVDPATGAPRAEPTAGNHTLLTLSAPSSSATRPPAPVVTGTRSAGRVELRWTYPTGTGIEDFRIYRSDAVTAAQPLYAQRYDRTGTGELATAATVTWVDEAAGTGPTTYHVCSVDRSFAESASCTGVDV